MDLAELELFLLINEPVFDVGEVQYSVCSPRKGLFCTWDSAGGEHDFDGFEALLDGWIIAGKPFRERAEELRGQYN